MTASDTPTPRTDAFIAGHEYLVPPLDHEDQVRVGNVIRKVMIDYATHARALERDLAAWKGQHTEHLPSDWHRSCPACLAESVTDDSEVAQLKAALAAAQENLAECRAFLSSEHDAHMDCHAKLDAGGTGEG